MHRPLHIHLAAFSRIISVGATLAVAGCGDFAAHEARVPEAAPETRTVPEAATTTTTALVLYDAHAQRTNAEPGRGTIFERKTGAALAGASRPVFASLATHHWLAGLVDTVQADGLVQLPACATHPMAAFAGLRAVADAHGLREVELEVRLDSCARSVPKPAADAIEVAHDATHDYSHCVDADSRQATGLPPWLFCKRGPGWQPTPQPHLSFPFA